MVQVYCDRCGRVITGMSAHERVSVTASGAGGGEIAKLDFCTYCADWAINTLMRRTMLGAGEKKGAKADKPAPIAPPKGEKDGLAWTAGQDKRPAAEAPPPEPLPTLSVKGYGAAEKRKIFDALVRYKVRTGPGWTERVSKACGGDVSRETLRAIVVDGLMVDIHVWRVIERGAQRPGRGGEKSMKATFILQADVPESTIQGIKERAAMDLERYGDVKVVKILVEKPREHEQLHL